MGCGPSLLSRMAARPGKDEAVVGSPVVAAIAVATTDSVPEAPPQTPADDTRDKFEWATARFCDNRIIELQEAGFVVAREVANGYAMLRRPRSDLSAHPFNTASTARVGGLLVSLGAHRIGASFVTRDVLDHPNGASLTMRVTLGMETYIFNGASVKVSFPTDSPA